jgi:hypothetical protein
LREKASASTDKKCKQLLLQLNEQLKPLADEHTFNEDTLKTQIYEGEKLIRELSASLVGEK